MASHGARFCFLCVCFLAVEADSFLAVVCEAQNVVLTNHQSVLSCVIKPKPGIKDVNIHTVVWKKTADTGEPLLCFRENELHTQPGYRFADPLWKENNMNVSLLIASTEVSNEGDYTVDVMTDSGNAKGRTKLQVTAKYNNPSIRLVKESNTPNSDKALLCKAQGGYPAGRLGWFDENKTEWTNSATLEVKKMDNGLFELTSKLPLLTGSTFSMYICAVYNSSEGKEYETSYALPGSEHVVDQVRDGGDQGAGSSRIIAPVVVIGSLIVGLLLALLIYRRRSNQARRPSSTPFLGQRWASPTEEPDDVDLQNPNIV